MNSETLLSWAKEDLETRFGKDKTFVKDAWTEVFEYARIGAAAKSIDCAASIAFEIQMDQVRRRDQEKETSEEWQVYNHGVFIAGKIKDALAVLASPEQQEPK